MRSYVPIAGDANDNVLVKQADPASLTYQFGALCIRYFDEGHIYFGGAKLINAGDTLLAPIIGFLDPSTMDVAGGTNHVWQFDSNGTAEISLNPVGSGNHMNPNPIHLERYMIENIYLSQDSSRTIIGVGGRFNNMYDSTGAAGGGGRPAFEREFAKEIFIAVGKDPRHYSVDGGSDLGCNQFTAWIVNTGPFERMKLFDDIIGPIAGKMYISFREFDTSN
jgi:hypothetical protein